MKRLVLFHQSTPYLTVFSLISAGYCVTRLLDGFQFVLAGSICLTAAVLFSIIWTITEDRADAVMSKDMAFDGLTPDFGRAFHFSNNNYPLNIQPVGYHHEKRASDVDSDSDTALEEEEEENRFEFDNFSDPFLEKQIKEESIQHDYSKDPAKLRMNSMRGFKF
jgi:hypothetical protein